MKCLEKEVYKNYIDKLDRNLMDIRDNAEVSLRLEEQGSVKKCYFVKVGVNPMLAWTKEDDKRLSEIIEEVADDMNIKCNIYDGGDGKLVQLEEYKKVKTGQVKAINKNATMVTTSKLFVFRYDDKKKKFVGMTKVELDKWCKGTGAGKDFWNDLKASVEGKEKLNGKMTSTHDYIIMNSQRFTIVKLNKKVGSKEEIIEIICGYGLHEEEINSPDFMKFIKTCKSKVVEYKI